MKKFTFIIVLLAVVLAVGAQKRPKAIVKLEKQLVGKFVEIPAGHYTEVVYNDTGQVVSKKEYTFSTFYMLSSEVTNKAYGAFLEDLQAQGRTADYEVARVLKENNPKLSVSGIITEMSPLKVDTFEYFKHPAYALYPVVEISYEGAILFCQWLNEKLGDAGFEYMLPTKAQWQYAARGGGHNWDPYPWGGPYLSNRNGYPLCNYKRVGDESITMKDSVLTVVDENELIPALHDFAFWICPAASFYPNNYGLYNMSGNVAEMVEEKGIALGGSYADPGYDVRIQSEKTYSEPSPMIGFRVIAVPKR